MFGEMGLLGVFTFSGESSSGTVYQLVLLFKYNEITNYPYMYVRILCKY